MTSGPTKGMTFQAIGEGRHRKPVRAERALVAIKGYRRYRWYSKGPSSSGWYRARVRRVLARQRTGTVITGRRCRRDLLRGYKWGYGLAEVSEITTVPNRLLPDRGLLSLRQHGLTQHSPPPREGLRSLGKTRVFARTSGLLGGSAPSKRSLFGPVSPKLWTAPF